MDWRNDEAVRAVLRGDPIPARAVRIDANELSTEALLRILEARARAGDPLAREFARRDAVA